MLEEGNIVPEEEQKESQEQTKSESEKMGVLEWIFIILLSPLLLYGILEEIVGASIGAIFKFIWRAVKFIFFLPWNLLKRIWS